MDRRKAFTLIELLVVISIIALLMSILMPSLSKAREQAQRLVCSSHMRDLMVGMEVYSVKWDGVYVPCMDGSNDGDGAGPAGGLGQADTPAYGAWIMNKDFRNIIGYKGSKTKIDMGDLGVEGLGTVMPAQFSCPTNSYAKKITLNILNQNFGTLASYGYNATEWYSSAHGQGGLLEIWGNTLKRVQVGHKPANIRRPANKAVFLDSNDWYVHWQGANYVTGWDLFREDGPGVYSEGGPTLYRHGEGTNVTFYDGHVAYMRKTAVWKATDFNANPKKPGMWVADASKIITPHEYPGFP
ncbi:MAG: prepilin-type N-terminal cleavage/methylation domain-containing protein [Planctomycetes bacterium]|nr:prepilin-type N-terminal cleavage/methylation domain-containing protein [Planctomycetota bacterium]